MAEAVTVSDNPTATMVAVVQHNAGTDVEQNLAPWKPYRPKPPAVPSS